MKRIFAISVWIVCLSICHEAIAENKTDANDAVYLVSNPQTARWSYIETDSNGKQTSTIYNSVESMEGDAVNGKLKLRIEESPAASPKDTIRSFIYYRFKDGEFMVDMNAVFADNLLEGKTLDSHIRDAIKERDPEATEEDTKEVLEKIKSQFKISGEVRGIPRYPKIGALPDYEFNFKISIISMKVTGEDRRIVGTEKIQTEAGQFDCFILEETITTKAMMIKEVEKTRSWYAYGIGLVKEMTYDKNGKLLSSMILKQID